MSMQDLTFRHVRTSDYPALKFMHDVLFPINYDDTFFERVVNGEGIVSFVAVAQQARLPSRMPTPTTVFINGEQLVGFITLKNFQVHELSTIDRHLLGMSDGHYNSQKVAYILTLGVAEEFRSLGVASKLLELASGHAAEASCQAIFLHVITYNEAAIGFYKRNEFQDLGILPNFYHITTGRTHNPEQVDYDAHLFVQYLGLPIVSWQVYFDSLIGMPVRHLIGTCLPPVRSRQRQSNTLDTTDSGASKWLRYLFGSK